MWGFEDILGLVEADCEWLLRQRIHTFDEWNDAILATAGASAMSGRQKNSVFFQHRKDSSVSQQKLRYGWIGAVWKQQKSARYFRQTLVLITSEGVQSENSSSYPHSSAMQRFFLSNKLYHKVTAISNLQIWVVVRLYLIDRLIGEIPISLEILFEGKSSPSRGFSHTSPALWE